MSAPQSIPPAAAPEHPDPTQNVFDHLRACLTVRDPGERNAQARETLNADINGLVANSGITELIGLACEVAQSLTDDQMRAEVAAQLLTPAARALLAATDDDKSLVWAVVMAHSLLTEEARTEVVGELLSRQMACETMANLVAGFVSERPGEERDQNLRQYLSLPICRAIAKSNSFVAIGNTAYAIARLPPEERSAAAAAAATLLPQGVAPVGMSGNVQATMYTLEAASFLPPDALESILVPLFIPRARAALVKSADPRVISTAAYSAATLLPPCAFRDAVLQDLLSPPACGVVADKGDVHDWVVAAHAATALPAGAARDAMLVRLLPANACAQVEKFGDAQRLADAAYAVTFLPSDKARSSALTALVTENACQLGGKLGSPSSWARLSFAAALLEDKDVREERLMSLVPQKCAFVAARGTDLEIRLMGHAAKLLPEGAERDAALEVLRPKWEKLPPLTWQEIESGPQVGFAGPPGGAARAAFPTGP